MDMVRYNEAEKSMLFSAISVGLSAFVVRLDYPTGEDMLGLQFGYFASYIFLFAVVRRLIGTDGWSGFLPEQPGCGYGFATLVCFTVSGLIRFIPGAKRVL